MDMGVLKSAALALGVWAAASHSASAEGDKVIFGIGVDPTFAHFIVADKKGFFAENDIDAEIKTFGFGSLTLDAVLAGETDVAAATELPTINAAVRGNLTAVVAANYVAPDYNAVVVSEDISSVEDLKGKNVAVKRNSASDYFLSRFLSSNGLTEDDLSVKNVAPPEMVPAMSRGDVDAFLIWEPWPTKALEIVPGAKILQRGGDTYAMTNFISFSKKLAADKDKAKRVMKSLVQADEFISENYDETVKMSADAFNLSEDVAKVAMDRVEFKITLSPEVLQHQEEAGKWLVNTGTLDTEPDYDDLTDKSILEGVDPSRVN